MMITKLLYSLVLLTVLVTIQPDQAQQLQAQCLKMDIMLVGDMSSSVQDNEQFIADAFDALTNKLELSDDGIRIGLITFNTGHHIWTPQTSNKGAVLFHIDNAIRNTRAGGETYMTDALMAAMTLLSNGTRDENTLKLIIIVSDGQPNSPSDAITVANQIKSLPGYAIFGVLVIDEEYSNTYYQHSIEDDSKFMEAISTVYVRTNYEALAQTIRDMDICL